MKTTKESSIAKAKIKKKGKSFFVLADDERYSSDSSGFGELKFDVEKEGCFVSLNDLE